MRALTIANKFSLVNGSVVGPTAVTATDASPCVFSWAAFPGANGDIVVLGGTTAPTGFTKGTAYFVVAKGTNSFELSATSGGSAIGSSSTGTAVTATLYAAAGDTTTSAPIDLLDSDSISTDPFIQEFVSGDGSYTEASPAVFSWGGGDNFAFADGDEAVIIDGTVSTDFVLRTTYYVINSDSAAGTYELALTPGGDPIDATVGAGSALTVTVTHNSAGDGVSQSPGAPFLPGYSGVLAVNLSSDIANATVYVEGADALADGSAGSYTYALNGADGETAAGLVYFFIESWPQWIRVRNVIAGSTGLGAGTAQVSVLGTG